MKLPYLFAVALTCFALPASAEIMLHGAYARVATPMAKTGAAFLTIMNHGDEDDRLIGVQSDAAMRVELHTHAETDGVMQMREVDGGFVIPAGESHTFMRGGDHVMFMGLAERWSDGDAIPVIFRFENAGEITAEIIVDSKRQPEEGGNAAHSH